MTPDSNPAVKRRCPNLYSADTRKWLRRIYSVTPNCAYGDVAFVVILPLLPFYALLFQSA
jgi:hypothetical protein